MGLENQYDFMIKLANGDIESHNGFTVDQYCSEKYTNLTNKITPDIIKQMQEKLKAHRWKD